MRDHGHVHRAPQLSRNRGLESTPPRLAPDARGSEPQPLCHPPHMSVHGQNVPPQGVEHDAQGGLPCHARQAGEVSFDCVILHVAESAQVQAALSCLDLSKGRLNLRGLGRCETGFVDERLQLVGRGVTYRMPCRERVSETGSTS